MILSESLAKSKGSGKNIKNRVEGGGLPSEEGFKPSVYYDIERLKRG